MLTYVKYLTIQLASDLQILNPQFSQKGGLLLGHKFTKKIGSKAPSSRGQHSLAPSGGAGSDCFQDGLEKITHN